MQVDIFSRIVKITTKPGVYIWKNQSNQILYIGKAKNLRRRMRSYFLGTADSSKISLLRESIKDFEIFICSTPREALLLERNLINKHKPPFNVLLVDDKRYPYIKIENDKKKGFSIEVVYKLKKPKRAYFFGPLPSGYGAKVVANLLRRETLYRDGLVIENKSFDYWEKEQQKVKKILSNSSNDYLLSLEEKMLQAAERLNFEIAEEYRQGIDFFKKIKEEQNVELKVTRSFDFFDFFSEKNLVFVKIFHYRLGILISRSERIFEIKKTFRNDVEYFLNDFYINNPLPDKIFLEDSWEGVEKELFIDSKKIVFPKKGTNKKILNLLRENNILNFEEKAAEFYRKKHLIPAILEEFKVLAKVKTISNFIIIDSSFSLVTKPVVAILNYEKGIINKKLSRHYFLEQKAEAHSRKSDVEYLKIALTRYLKSNPGQKKTIIVDGGRQQISEARKVLQKLNLNFDIIGLPKNEKHMNLGIIDSGGELVLKMSDQLSNFINKIQFEVDKFAKSFNHKKSLNSINESSLLKIRGVGKKTEKKLLNVLGSYQAVMNASLESLSKIVGNKLAKNIYNGLSRRKH